MIGRLVTHLSLDKYHLLDSFTAALLSIPFVAFLEGIGQIVAIIIGVVATFNGIYGIHNKNLDSRLKKLEIQLKEKELKNIENAQSVAKHIIQIEN